MSLWGHSQSDVIIQFNERPAIVAEICQKVLKSLGRIRTVSPSTGVIVGNFSINPLAQDVYITITVSQKENLTEVIIKTERDEGLFSDSGGAQKGLSKFIEILSNRPELHKVSSSGWAESNSTQYVNSKQKTESKTRVRILGPKDSPAELLITA